MLFQRSLIEDSLKLFAPARTAPVVAHYTRIGTLCHFLPPGSSGWGSAWATPVQFLNDRKELALGLEVLDRVAHQPPSAGPHLLLLIRSLQDTHGGLETDAFQMSFSGNPDELGQWRGYAANGMGCSLVTIAAVVSSAADVAGWVLYDTAKQEAFARLVLDDLRHETNSGLIEQALVATASFIKHKGFAPEKEFRLLRFPQIKEIEFRESGDRLVPYVDYLKTPASHILPIRRIVVGPGWQLSNHDAGTLARSHVVQPIRRLLDARGLTATRIKSSRIPYDPR